MSARKSRVLRPVSGGVSRLEDGALVLPRSGRRLLRFAVALCTGKVELPRHIGKLSFLAYCAFVGGHAIAWGGYWPNVKEYVTTTAGFALDNVKLSGNVHTSEIDVLQALNLDGVTSLVSLNVDAAQKKIEALPWVEKVEVRKVYPHTINVMIKERQAYGIWQHGDELSLIEADGTVIAPLRDSKFATLPLFVGRDAETAAQDIEKDFAPWPEFKDRIKAFVRVGSRRWDVYLKNGVVVKLPEDNVETALARLKRMESDQQLLERDIAAVDLRLPDRMAIQLTPEALARRQKAVAARTKALAKAVKEDVI
nr:cell division protein FtsQ/DivIB [Allorhizobium sonneratiae]